MKTDLYTKIILTIIAVCLSINLIKDVPLFSKVEAQDDYREIYRVPSPVNLIQINGSDLSRGALLPVRVVGPVQVERE